MGRTRMSSLLLLLTIQSCFILPAIAGAEKAYTALALRTRKVNTSPRSLLYFHRNVSLTVELSIGSPPQNISMVLDTGSELSWLRCSSPDRPSFRPKLSSSYSPVFFSSPICRDRTRDLHSPPYRNPSNNLCRVSVTYADGTSADGDLSSDVLHVGQSPPSKTFFSCVDSPSRPSAPDDTATAGILGMNRGSLSFISQTGARKFSYCISDRDANGLLLLGGGAAALPFPLSLNYTPLVRMSLPLPYFDRVAYSVQLEGIKVGGVILPIPKSVLEPDHTGAGQTMIDSGSQFTFLLGPAYSVLKREFLRQTAPHLRPLNEAGFAFQSAFDTCFTMGVAVVPPRELPAVTLMFRGGAEVTVGAERLLYPATGEFRGGGRDAVWCLTFGNSDLVPVEAYVIGHHHQQNVWVEYDLELDRLGFAPVRCDIATQQLGRLL